GGVRERDPGEGEPDRHAHRDAAGDRDGQGVGVRGDHLAPVRRDRGHVHRRPRGGHGGRADQDGLGEPHGSGGQVQPVAPDRRGAWRGGGVSRRRTVSEMTKWRWAALVVLVGVAIWTWNGATYSGSDYRALLEREQALIREID